MWCADQQNRAFSLLDRQESEFVLGFGPTEALKMPRNSSSFFSFFHVFWTDLDFWSFIDEHVFGLKLRKTANDIELVFSSRVLFGVCIIAFASCPLLVLQFLSGGMKYSALAIAVGTFSFLGCIEALRRSKSSVTAGYMVGIILFVAMGVCALEHGGFAALAPTTNNL